jgi:hypothetical protein
MSVIEDREMTRFEAHRKAPSPNSFASVAQELIALHDKKGADYGIDSDEYHNIRQSELLGIPAWLGAVTRGNDKMVRIQAFAVKGKLENESMENSLQDLATYAIISLVLWRESQKADNAPQS